MPSTELQNLVRKLSQKNLAKESRAQVRNSFQKAFQKIKVLWLLNMEIHAEFQLQQIKSIVINMH